MVCPSSKSIAYALRHPKDLSMQLFELCEHPLQIITRSQEVVGAQWGPLRVYIRPTPLGTRWTYLVPDIQRTSPPSLVFTEKLLLSVMPWRFEQTAFENASDLDLGLMLWANIRHFAGEPAQTRIKLAGFLLYLYVQKFSIDLPISVRLQKTGLLSPQIPMPVEWQHAFDTLLDRPYGSARIDHSISFGVLTELDITIPQSHHDHLAWQAALQRLLPTLEF